MFPGCLQDRLSEIQRDDDEAVGILVRHAERTPIHTAEDASLAPLTEDGRHQAKLLGNQLALFPVDGIFSSVIERCVDTAKCVVEGLGEARKIQTHPILLKAYMADWEIAKREIFRGNPMQIIHAYLNGAQIPGMLSPGEGSQNLLQFVTRHVKKGAITLFFTHDALIMPFCQHFTGTRFSPETNVPWMASSIIRIANDRIFVDGTRVQSPGFLSEGR